MTTIYLVRHAEAEGNLYRIVQGQHESCLTTRGWRQVRALERRFASIPVDAVYTSDLYRAKATAMAICRPRGIEPRCMPALREIYVGEWEGRTFGDITRRDPVQMARFSREIDRWYVRGAETPRQVLGRAMRTLRAAALENAGGCAAVVSHGYILRLLLGAIEGYTMAEIGETPHGDNTAVSMVYAERGSFQLVYRDDNSHLQTPEYLAEEKPIQRQNALEPGLWFAPADETVLSFLAAEALREADSLADMRRMAAGIPPHGIRAIDRSRLEADAMVRVTLAAYQGDTPVGLLQLGPDPGWIPLIYVREQYRERGYGIQILGQAVQQTRRSNGDRLYVLPTEVSTSFFREHGFLPTSETAGDRRVWTKDITFPPL